MNGKRLGERFRRLNDIHEIQNLIGRLVYLHAAGRYDAETELYAKKTPGVRVDLLGWGIYEGTEGIRRFAEVYKFLDKGTPGQLHMHPLTTPVIEVAGDGNTAKGVWICTGLNTVPLPDKKPQAFWSWCKYGVDFVKEEGNWLLWHLYVAGIFMTPYEKSWVEAPPPAPPYMEGELKPDRPSPRLWMYNINAVTEYDPVLPEPYETWDESMSYVD